MFIYKWDLAEMVAVATFRQPRRGRLRSRKARL